VSATTLRSEEPCLLDLTVSIPKKTRFSRLVLAEAVLVASISLLEVRALLKIGAFLEFRVP
jgi:tRNA C32,U32 (ribose-2'-O)-methylase TrmJ